MIKKYLKIKLGVFGLKEKSYEKNWEFSVLKIILYLQHTFYVNCTLK